MNSHPHDLNLRWLVAAVPLLLLVTACSTGSATSGPAVTSTGALSSSTTLAPFKATFVGAGTHPTVTVEAASPPWSLFKGFAVINGSDGVSRGVSFWDVGKVARDPCHSVGHLYDPGSTVDDLVAALEAQAMRHATPAKKVTLAGYSGKYLQWSVPTHMVVRGDGNFVACDLQGDGHRDFVSWEGRGGQGERWAQTAGQVDQLWILNVHGQRLVVDAAHSANATTAQVSEENAIVHSLAFN